MSINKKESGQPKYLSDKRIADRLDVSRATIWRWTSEKKFPQPVKLSPNCTRWKLSDIEKWEEEKA